MFAYVHLALIIHSRGLAERDFIFPVAMGTSSKSRSSLRQIRSCLKVFITLILSFVLILVLCLTISFFNISSSPELILPSLEQAEQRHDHINSRQLLSEMLVILHNLITDIDNGSRHAVNWSHLY